MHSALREGIQLTSVWCSPRSRRRCIHFTVSCYRAVRSYLTFTLGVWLSGDLCVAGTRRYRVTQTGARVGVHQHLAAPAGSGTLRTRGPAPRAGTTSLFRSSPNGTAAGKRDRRPVRSGADPKRIYTQYVTKYRREVSIYRSAERHVVQIVENARRLPLGRPMPRLSTALARHYNAPSDHGLRHAQQPNLSL